MATRFETESARRSNGQVLPHNEVPLRDLLKQLTEEGANLVRGEIALARLELKESARSVALGGVKLASALGLVLVGMLALTAFMIIGLGILLDGAYWASALIVGLAMLAIGGLLAQRGMAALKGNSLKPEAAVASLQQDKRWAGQEMRDLKEGLTS